MNSYIIEWKRYTTAAKYINDLFRYLNRHWVKREMEEGKKDVYDVYTVSALSESLCLNILLMSVVTPCTVEERLVRRCAETCHGWCFEAS